MKIWKCRVCGYTFNGDEPPKECPQCSSTSLEFIEKKDQIKLKYDKKSFDVLLINGSSHSAHNSNILADYAQKALNDRNVSYRRYNLNEYDIRHCWCCYSMRDAACTYPCRDQIDDMPAFHEMILDSKAVIIVSPINWNNMSARLKDFLDRCTCIQNLYLLGKKSLTVGKIAGLIVNGHEDGALKTAMDIFTYLQQMGYILAPYGFAYRIHGSNYNSNTDSEFYSTDAKIKRDVDGIVNNVVQMLKLDIERELKSGDKIISVCE